MLDGCGTAFWHLWPHFWHPGEVLGTPGETPWTQTPKNIKKIIFWDLILDYFLGHNLTLLGYVFEVRLPKASG